MRTVGACLIWPNPVLNKSEIVFARTSPKHKLEIGMISDVFSKCFSVRTFPFPLVRRAQALGHIVGVCVVSNLLDIASFTLHVFVIVLAMVLMTHLVSHCQSRLIFTC